MSLTTKNVQDALKKQNENKVQWKTLKYEKGAVSSVRGRLIKDAGGNFFKTFNRNVYFGNGFYTNCVSSGSDDPFRKLFSELWNVDQEKAKQIKYQQRSLVAIALTEKGKFTGEIEVHEISGRLLEKLAQTHENMSPIAEDITNNAHEILITLKEERGWPTWDVQVGTEIHGDKKLQCKENFDELIKSVLTPDYMDNIEKDAKTVRGILLEGKSPVNNTVDSDDFILEA